MVQIFLFFERCSSLNKSLKYRFYDYNHVRPYYLMNLMNSTDYFINIQLNFIYIILV